MNPRLKYEWADAVMSESGPRSSTVRLVLLVLSTHMNGDGSKCFPGIPLLVKETALHRSTVLEAIRQAKADGWIAVEKIPRSGQRGGAYSFYHPLTPTNTVAEDDPLKSEYGRPEHEIGRPERSNTVAEDDPTTNTETSPLETPSGNLQNIAIALKEVPTDWTPPGELTEHSTLYELLTPAEKQLVAIEVAGSDIIAVQPRELQLLPANRLLQFQYAAFSRNGRGAA